jgi:hypothetical protein
MRLLTLLVALVVGAVGLSAIAPLWSPSRDAIVNTIFEQTRLLELSAAQMQSEAEQIINALETLAQQGAEAELYTSLLLIVIPYAVWHLLFVGLWAFIAAWLYRYFTGRFRPLQQRFKELQDEVEQKQRLLEQIEQPHTPTPPPREFLRRSSGR